MAAGTHGTSRGVPELRNRRLKEKAVAFYAQHDVPGAVERLLNEMVFAEPSDVYGYMAEYFHGLSKEPVIAKLMASEALDSSGGKAIEIQLHCTVNGVEKLVSTASTSLELHPKEPDPLHLSASPAVKGSKGVSKGSKANLQKGPESSEEDITSEQPPKSVGYLDPVQTVNNHIEPALKGLSPKKQQEVDKVLEGITVPVDDQKPHPSALLATSCVVATAGASLHKTSLYLHLANVHFPEVKRFTMPIPVVGVIGGGHLGCGKLKFREFCLTPLPGSIFPEQVGVLMPVYCQVGKVLAAKLGPSAQGTLSASGIYCPVVDKPEQALDLLQEATRMAGLELNKDVGVLIDVGADKLYDQEKGKYEVITGQWKSSEDMINLYSDLLNSYPGLLGYIDPLHHQDTQGWLKLHERLGFKCLLVASNTLEQLSLKKGGSVGRSEGEQTDPKSQSDKSQQEIPVGESAAPAENEEPCINYLSCAALSLNSTLSALVEKATHFRGHSHYLMLQSPPNLTMNSLIADLAVAVQCRFLRMGAPIGITSSGILSRLLHIREELVAGKSHEPTKAHLFTCSPIPEGQANV